MSTVPPALLLSAPRTAQVAIEAIEWTALAPPRAARGQRNLLAHTLKRFGIRTSFVAPDDVEGMRRAVSDRTRLLFAEIIGNPRIDVLDLEAVAEIAHAAAVPLLIDSTFATSYLARSTPKTAHKVSA